MQPKKLIQYFLLCLFLIPLLWFGKTVCQNVTFFDVLWIFQNKSWKAKFNPEKLWFSKKMFKPILVFKRNSWVQTTKQHLTPPPPNKERRRRGVLLKTRVVAASSQNNYSKEIPLLKLSSTFWVSDIKASPTWEFDILHSLWKKNSNWQMVHANEWKVFPNIFLEKCLEKP